MVMFDYYNPPIAEVPTDDYGLRYPKYSELPPISDELKKLIAQQREIYDATFDEKDPGRSGFASDLEEQEFTKIQVTIVERLRQELPNDFDISLR